MQRSDLLAANAGIFKEQGTALNNYASRNVKVDINSNNSIDTQMLRCWWLEIQLIQMH